MKNTVIKTYLKYVIACALLLVLMNCYTIQKADGQPLVVENHECFLKNYTYITTEVVPLFISIDLPVKGEQPLLDSLTDFLNVSLYRFFDNGGDQHLPYQTVYSKDIVHLIEHYRDAYKPFFLSDSTVEHEFNPDCLMLKLAAQTDTYVTYEIDWVFYGEGLEVAKEWATFVRADGHRLTEIISNKNMLRFYKKYPELRSKDIWLHIHTYDNKDYLVGSVGLLNDSVAHQYAYAPGIVEDVHYPLELILPYLSKEAKSLIAKRK
jgi:hypothetical protein